jgi:2-polyprenyl-3-methyl-5-hydroxy-6-metoxy-1,4-benzoquinol methylase
MWCLELEYVNCEICGDERADVLCNVRDRWFDLPGEFALVKCRNCGLVYLNSRPVEDQISHYYPERYSPHKARGMNRFVKFWHFYLRLFNGHLHLLDDLPVGTVLDVGCGSGEHLWMLKRQGWQVRGVDVSESAAEEARKLGVEVFVGQLHEAKFQDGEFDAVVMIHSLEHMYHPSFVLKEVRRIISDGGVLVIEVPNIASVEARVFRQYWIHTDAPRHLYHFSPISLGRLLEKNGFFVERVGYNPSPVALAGSINYFVGKRLAWVLKHPIAQYGVYTLLPLTSLLAKCGLGASVIVRARKKMARCEC